MVEIITKGDYSYVEEASKKYYKKIADNIQLIDKYINSKEFLNILTVDNFKNDGPNFVNNFNDLDIIQKK